MNQDNISETPMNDKDIMSDDEDPNIDVIEVPSRYFIDFVKGQLIQVDNKTDEIARRIDVIYKMVNTMWDKLGMNSVVNTEPQVQQPMTPMKKKRGGFCSSYKR